MAELQDQAVRQQCKALQMPTIGGQFARLAEAATREGQSHVGYLEALLAAEMEERENRAITRLLHGVGHPHAPAAFSEWSQVIPNPRRCKALIDRRTDQAHIITTGSDAYRFRRTTAQRKAAKS